MKKIAFFALAAISLASCKNNAWEFPDYKYTTVYFPYQSPVRTLILGKDIIDNTLDNERKFMVMASLGGVYKNERNIVLDVVVDNSLTNNLRYDVANGDAVEALPANYYSFPKEMKITIPAGSFMGGVEVQLTDAFFADPKAIKKSYVLPLRITKVTNADSVLSGKSDKDNPDPRIAADWVATPKNFVLYAVKYINPWHGTYLRRGKSEVKGVAGRADLDTNVVYRNQFVERDELVNVATESLTSTRLPLTTRVRGNKLASFQMIMQFDGAGKCTIAQPAGATYRVTGNGEFVADGDMWGNEKRDVLRLSYTLNTDSTIHTIMDTIVIRDRGVKFETFAPVVVQ